MLDTKKCYACLQTKPRSEFASDAGRYDGLNSRCRPCDSLKKILYQRTLAGQISRRERRHRRRLLEGSLSKNTVQLVIERNIAAHDQAQCCYCGIRLDLFGGWHLEHLTPLSRGGTNEVANLDLSCSKCNLSKGAKTWEQFLDKIGHVDTSRIYVSDAVDLEYPLEKYELCDGEDCSVQDVLPDDSAGSYHRA